MGNLHSISSEKKPENINDFKIWFSKKFDYDPKLYQNYYNVAADRLRDSFVKSSFWEAVKRQFSNINDEYRKLKGYQLLTTNEAPDIYIKSLDSLLIKAFRKNILNNEQYPEEPNGGWITPENWFTSINDILRTTIIVKYLDGVEFLLEKITIIARENSCDFTYSLEAREEGYYAAHGGAKITLDLVGKDFAPKQERINVEIQVTTELQEIIKNLLHKYYEENRKKTKPKDYKWQWDYRCDEFASNYLGHIVHYVEGMIVEIRDKQITKK